MTSRAKIPKAVWVLGFVSMCMDISSEIDRRFRRSIDRDRFDGALAGDFRMVFWFAVLPGVLAVVLLVVGVHEPATASTSVRAMFQSPSTIRKLFRLRIRYTEKSR